MKVMLINPKYPVYLKTPAVPLGLLSIASYLKSHGVDVLFVERFEVSNRTLKKLASEYQPDIIGFSVISFLGSSDAKAVTKMLRAITHAPIVWGGHGSNAIPELVFKEAGPDYIMEGEGEITWLELVRAIESNKDPITVPGLFYIKEDKVLSTGSRELANPATFAPLDWSLIHLKTYESSFFLCDKMQYLYATKGCFGACTFCPNKQFHHSKNRCRDLDSILRDVDYLYHQGTNGIYFSDELFMPNREIRTQFCKALADRHYPLVWGCMMRIGVLNEDDIRLMYEAGCRWILFGVESGNQERIKKIHKNIDLSLVRQNVEWCENVGITTNAAFIIGYPDETEEELTQTLRFAENSGASLLQVNIYTPIPNSEMYEELVARGLYQRPKSLRACIRKVDANCAERVYSKCSHVSSLDLKVVHHHYQWKAFCNRDAIQGDSYGIVKKMFRDTMNRIFTHGLTGFVYGSYKSAQQFFTVFFYANFFPSIRKKYGLK